MLLPVTGVTLFLLGALTLGAREVVAAGHRQGVTYRALALARLDIVWSAASSLAAVLMGAAMHAWWGTRPGLVLTLVLVAPTLVRLAVIDLDVHRLPNALTLRAAGTVAAGLVLAGFVDAHRSGATVFDADAARRAVVGAVALGACYLVLALLGGGSGMGLGDVKLAPTLGALLAWAGWDVWLTGTVAAFLLGGAWGVVLLARGRGRQARMPFGPFMIAGALAALALA
ncbi:prepilin peptidase [Dermacoccus nishinomiyaensis]|uniref:prepilin peptidase n=1 Tax=Dermacoccus nishinomiyaensis TaxID=1274 RepID=UPI001EF4FA2F|nr:prepilin peptidase [Dermacoccus nishinomiyaensis]MCG7429943.1 prepilin peptidase [Dermacoccus nishinomiyaensis]